MKVKQSLEIPGPYDGNEYARAARQKIDDDISELVHRIRFLKVKRNELAPVSVLPLELLSYIFVLVRDLSIHNRFDDYQCPDQLASWIHIGHICRHWREIALDCPNLWSVPVFARPNMAQEMIRRSKMAPLTIKWTPGAWSSEAREQFETALTQVTRIQSIELALGRHSQRSKDPFSPFSQPTPLLEGLFLFDPTHDNNISFPPDILSHAPRLRRIKFDGLKINWESAVFKHGSLTDLRLLNTPCRASTMGQMMNALHHLPNLRILTLRHSVPPSTTSDGNMKTVKFKFLERLELNVKAADCVSFLRHIQYPSSMTFKLHSFPTSVEDGMTILSLLGQSLCCVQSDEARINHSPVLIRSGRLTSSHGCIEITFSNNANNTTEWYRTGGSDSIIDICFDDISDRLNQGHGRLLTSICNSFDLSSLEGLLLGWDFTSNEIPTIREFLGKLPELKVINISRSLPKICVALAVTGRGENPKPNPTHAPLQIQGTSQLSSFPIILLPALETLIVQSVYFKQRQQQHSGIIDRLIDLLIERSNFNMPIDHLSLRQCSRVRTWLTGLLGELIPRLDVDGKVVDGEESVYGWSGEDTSSDEDEDEEDEDENEYSGDGS